MWRSRVGRRREGLLKYTWNWARLSGDWCRNVSTPVVVPWSNAGAAAWRARPLRLGLALDLFRPRAAFALRRCTRGSAVSMKSCPIGSSLSRPVRSEPTSVSSTMASSASMIGSVVVRAASICLIALILSIQLLYSSTESRA